MFGIPNTWIILVFVALLGGTYTYGHHEGYVQKSTEDAIEIAKLNDEARTKEQQVTEKFSQITTQLRKAKDELKSKQASIDARIDSGELRLPSNCSVHSPSDTASGDGSQASNSDRQAIKDIVALTTEGDAAITELNSCITKYNEVRSLFNKAGK